MLKRTFATCILLLTIVFIVGCTQTPEASQNTCAVTYYDSDGTSILYTEAVEKGSVLTAAEIEKDGFSLIGFFATPQLTHKFDFTEPINNDVSIYCGFVEQVADTREFYIVGGGTSPLLLTSDWGNIINPEHQLVKAQESNEYAITLDLNEGDEFQFVINSSWNHQRGFGYLSITSQNEVVYFSGNAYGDANPKRSNIKCLVPGNYTFILTTYPSADSYDEDDANFTEDNKECFNMNSFDKIEWTYNGNVSGEMAETVTTYYMKGSGITDWEDRYIDHVKMTSNEGIHTVTIPLRAGEEFLFTSLAGIGDSVVTGNEYLRYSNFDEESVQIFESNDSMNIITKKGGVYTFVYDPESAILTASLDEEGLPVYDYYIKGTFGGTDWSTEFNENYQLNEQEAGSYVYILDRISLETGDEFGISSVLHGASEAGEWGEDNYTLVTFYNSQYIKASGDDNANADFMPNEDGYGNITCIKSGKYKVIFDAYTAQLTFIELD